jgi:hypothetical protein
MIEPTPMQTVVVLVVMGVIFSLIGIYAYQNINKLVEHEREQATLF